MPAPIPGDPDYDADGDLPLTQENYDEELADLRVNFYAREKAREDADGANSSVDGDLPLKTYAVDAEADRLRGTLSPSQ
ncbi:hypothetical protein [Pseudonocardia sp.]|uniref:hypothetical protein n=1 Tax=Pseudonocardia sp. TaxID=60912 RepID=UPI00262EBAC2|nr:hypothetical protein [Pseudonocardia sp.]